MTVHGPFEMLSEVDSVGMDNCILRLMMVMNLTTLIMFDALVRRNRIAFVGDAAHTLDPILALGGGLALLDANMLSEALAKNGTTDSLSEKFWPGKVEIERSLFRYEEARYNRLRRLHLVSNMAQMVGHIESPGWCSTRDSLLRLLPISMKGKTFDHFIRLVAETR